MLLYSLLRTCIPTRICHYKKLKSRILVGVVGPNSSIKEECQAFITTVFLLLAIGSWIRVRLGRVWGRQFVRKIPISVVNNMIYMPAIEAGFLGGECGRRCDKKNIRMTGNVQLERSMFLLQKTEGREMSETSEVHSKSYDQCVIHFFVEHVLPMTASSLWKSLLQRMPFEMNGNLTEPKSYGVWWMSRQISCQTFEDFQSCCGSMSSSLVLKETNEHKKTEARDFLTSFWTSHCFRNLSQIVVIIFNTNRFLSG